MSFNAENRRRTKAIHNFKAGFKDLDLVDTNVKNMSISWSTGNFDKIQNNSSKTRMKSEIGT